ncbi:MAG TPA: acyltransferase family protein [Rhizobacter sp.]|nr:acyltransferase family protein [Rhizobacter sp.]
MVEAHPAAPGRYIRHLDGMRCLAVVLVVLFHADSPWVTGGFVGVDVFFVLSGFLMTGILYEKALDRDGLKSFFAGRARRIVPAYAATLLVCALVSALLFLPVHVKNMAPSLLSAPFFLSNLVFWKTTDYFSQDLAYNPLLHTWSLALEWQFYIVYPLVFIVLQRHRRLIPPAVLGIGLASFAFAYVLMSHSHTLFAFYQLPARVWEFIVGGLVVFVPPNRLNKVSGQALSLIGLAAIVASGMLYSSHTPFPGVTAALPCLGAALLIYAGGCRGPVHALLTNAPVVRIGQWSYSIYLWHWPLLVFAKYVYPPGAFRDAPWFIPFVVIASVLLGHLSWKYIESPFRARSRTALAADRPVQATAVRPLRLRAFVAFSVICWAMGSWMYLSDGLPFRFSPQVTELSNAYKNAGQFRDCLSRTPSPEGGAAGLCRLGRADAPVSFLMLGDSHGAALADGISRMAATLGKAGVLSVSDSCPPVSGFQALYVPARTRCAAAQKAIPALVSSLQPKFILLHAAWQVYFHADAPQFKAALKETLDALALAHHHVYIVGDTPGARDNVPLNLAKEAAFGAKTPLVYSVEEMNQSTGPVEDFLKDEARRHGFVYISLGRRLCDAGSGCRIMQNGQPLYWDGVHLTGFGSQYVAGLIEGDIPLAN